MSTRARQGNRRAKRDSASNEDLSPTLAHVAGGAAFVAGLLSVGYLAYQGLSTLSEPVEESVSRGSEVVPRRQISAEVSHPEEEETDNHPFVCPITLQIMKDPVVTPHGICFEREAIVEWLQKSTTCPITKKPLSADQLITCYSLKNAIEEYEKLRAMKIRLDQNSTNETQPVVKPRFEISVPEKWGEVEVWSSRKISNEDGFKFPSDSKFLVFPASNNYVFGQSTGFICLDNAGDHDVTLVSRERAQDLFTPFNTAGRIGGSYVLPAHTKQGFDFVGSWCIEVLPSDHPISLSVYNFACKGGGKGNWLKMTP